MIKFIVLIFSISYLFADNVVINEILYNPDGPDSGYEWIELYNPTSNNINLENWQLLNAGDEFELLYIFPPISISANGYLLIGGAMVPNCDLYTTLSFQNGGDATDGIRIVSFDGNYKDTILYDEPNLNNLPDDIYEIATQFAPVASSNNSLSRFEDGIDSDNCQNDWFESFYPTPGEANFYPIDLAIVDQYTTEIEGIYTLSTFIHNLSTMGVYNGEAELETSLNCNQLAICELPEIPANAIIQFDYELGSSADGYFLTGARVNYLNDNNLANNEISSSFLVGMSPIVINEILYKDSEQTCEWVELFNRSECEYIVDNFVIKDASGAEISLYSTIYPHDYLVISNNAKQILDYFPMINPEKVLQADSWAILNNSGDQLILSDQYYTVFDSTTYIDDSCPVDISIERVNPYFDENISWLHSLSEFGATPTLINSVHPLGKDIAIEILNYEIFDNELHHQILLSNLGINQINEVNFLCKYDENEIVSELIEITDILVLEFETSLPEDGYHQVSYEIISNEDENPNNNFLYRFYNQNYLPFVINEIMYSPVTDEPEWIELKINKYMENLDFFYLVVGSDTLLLPNNNCEYLLLTASAEDSLFLAENYNLENVPIFCNLAALTNSGEYLELGDFSGNVIESFIYDPNWNDEMKGISIERINPQISANLYNWDRSVNNCTPGRVNSIFTSTNPYISEISISPNPFSPYKNEHTIISFKLPDIISKCTLRIYDLKGRLIRKIINQEFYGSDNCIIFDGKNEQQQNLSIGIYVVLLEAVTKNSGKVIRLQDTIVIAK